MIPYIQIVSRVPRRWYRFHTTIKFVQHVRDAFRKMHRGNNDREKIFDGVQSKRDRIDSTYVAALSAAQEF